jgi:hypothetical protein
MAMAGPLAVSVPFAARSSLRAPLARLAARPLLRAPLARPSPVPVPFPFSVTATL